MCIVCVLQVLEYEKELGIKTVECQEMSEALKLEQNLNNKLYDDVSTRHKLIIIIIFIIISRFIICVRSMVNYRLLT